MSSDHEPVFAIYNFDAPPIPEGGNYRRFLLIIKELKVPPTGSPCRSTALSLSVVPSVCLRLSMSVYVSLSLPLPDTRSGCMYAVRRAVCETGARSSPPAPAR